MRSLIIDEMYEKSLNDEGDSMHEHLPTLLKYAFKCDHITEMGVGTVHSTWAFVKSFPEKLISYDIWKYHDVELVEKACKETGINFQFMFEDTTDTIIEQTDFLFIDTLHIYEQLSKELELHANKVNKFIAFHDIESFGFKDEFETTCSKKGLMPAIKEFLEKNPEWVIDYQTQECCGLMIIKKKKGSSKKQKIDRNILLRELLKEPTSLEQKINSIERNMSEIQKNKMIEFLKIRYSNK